MQSLNCSICYEQRDRFITLHDTCRFCTACLTDWITIEIDEKNLSIQGHMTCPMSTCNQKSAINQVIPDLELDQTKTVYDAFFKKYLLKSSDVIKCPQSNCNYAGFTTEKHFGCKKAFNCEFCQTDWGHPIALGSSDGFFIRMLTELRKEFIAKRCPRCGIFISRTQGCNHMHCTVCNTDFQWNDASYRGWFVVRIILAIVLLTLLVIYRQEIWAFIKDHKESFVTCAEYVGLYFAIPAVFVLECLYHSFISNHTPSFRRCNVYIGELFALTLHLIPLAIWATLFNLYPNFAKMVGIVILVYFGLGFLFTTMLLCFMVGMLAARERRVRRPDEIFNPEEQVLLEDDENAEIIPISPTHEEEKMNSENQSNVGLVENNPATLEVRVEQIDSDDTIIAISEDH